MGCSRARSTTTISRTSTSSSRPCSRTWRSRSRCSRARQGLQAGRDPRHQHFDARRERDRGGDLAAGGRARPALLQPRERDEAAGSGARRRHLEGGARDGDEALASTIKKVGVVAGVCDGFVGNRMLHGYVREAGFLLEEGALPQQVDKVIEDFGFAMGPFRVERPGGTRRRLVHPQAPGRHAPAHLRYSNVADQICEMGRFGQKTGAGWYQLRGRQPHAGSGPGDRSADRQGIEGSRHRTARDHRSGDPRALHVRADQRTARRSSRRASRCARATSTSCTSTAMVSRAIAAARCSTPTAWAWTRCTRRSSASTAARRVLDAVGLAQEAGRRGRPLQPGPRTGRGLSAALRNEIKRQFPTEISS